MSTLADYNLKENPFRIGPPLDPTDLVWAGFANLKKELETRIKYSIVTSPSRMVLNWGRYGSGKTHAANYYSRTDILSELCQASNKPPAISIKINLPRTTKDPVQAFLRSFFGQIGLQKMKDHLAAIEAVVDRETLLSIISAVSSDGVITELIETILDATPEEMGPIEGYLFGDSTKGTLAKIGLPSGLKDDEQVVNLLSTYINTITYEKSAFSTFLLWIDEFEDIDTLNKTSQDRFTTFLRQLFDKTPNNLLLFLNFTPKTFFNIEDLSIILGEALSTRTKLRIDFQEPRISEAKEYLEQLLNHSQYRLEETQDRFIPFTDQSVEYILAHIGRLSIRKINEVFSLVLELALIQEAERIDQEVVDSIKSEIIYWQAV
jgi:hypothetical protein